MDNDTYNKEPKIQRDGPTESAAGADAGTAYKRERTLRRRRVAWLLLVPAVVVIATVAMTARSLPDSSLYGAKVGILEPIVGRMQFTDAMQAAHHLSLLERRLEEMKRLQTQDRLSGDAFTVLAREMGKNVDAFVSTEERADMPQQERVTVTSKVVSVVRAAEIVAERNQNDSPDAQQIEDFRRAVTRVHEEKIEGFVESAEKEAAHAFITERLAVLERALNDDNLSADSIGMIENDIQDTARALSRDDLVSAVRAVMKAEQQIETTWYLTGTAAVQ